MNSESKSKKDIFYLILLILTMLTMVVGITFTYFSLLAKEKKDSTQIRTGTLAIDYIDGREIDTYLLLPITEPTLNSKYSVYKKKFSVSSKGTLAQNLDLYINVTENKFTDRALGFALYDEYGNKLSVGSIPKTGSVLMDSGLYLDSGAKRSFTVLIWLKENYQNQDYEQGRTFIGGFDITATQVKYE